MLSVLRPLHQKIEQGHTTLKEQSFNQVRESLQNNLYNFRLFTKN